MNNIVLHRIYIDPKMPDFIQDEIFMGLNKLQFVEIVQP